MAFAGISYLAIIVAAIAGFVLGAVYYGILSKPWMKAARIDPSRSTVSPSLFVTTFLAELVMAWILAGLVGHLGPGQVTLWNGVISAGFVWLGFVATTLVVNHRYGGFGWDLTFIDAAHWLLVLVAMGAIIGLLGT